MKGNDTSKHFRVWFEEPDLLAGRITGWLDAEAAMALVAEEARLSAGREFIYVLGDMSGLTGIDPSAWRPMSKVLGSLPMRGWALFGLGVGARVAIGGIASLIDVLRGVSVPSALRSTEAEARAWIAERRRVDEMGRK